MQTDNREQTEEIESQVKAGELTVSGVWKFVFCVLVADLSSLVSRLACSFSENWGNKEEKINKRISKLERYTYLEGLKQKILAAKSVRGKAYSRS